MTSVLRKSLSVCCGGFGYISHIQRMVSVRVYCNNSAGGQQLEYRAAPTDRAREFPANEFVYATRRALGIEEYLATGCPRCHRNRDGGTITTMHARTCPRDGAQVNMHEPLKYALSRALNGLRVKHDVESGAPFTGEPVSYTHLTLPTICSV